MLQEIRRRPIGSELNIMEQERKRREELYQVQLNERSQSHENLLQVQEQLLKIFAKLKVCLERSIFFSRFCFHHGTLREDLFVFN